MSVHERFPIVVNVQLFQVEFMCLVLIWQTLFDYGFYLWMDPKPEDFLKDLLLDLCDVVWTLRNELAEVRMQKDIVEEILSIEEMQNAEEVQQVLEVQVVGSL